VNSPNLNRSTALMLVVLEPIVNQPDAA